MKIHQVKSEIPRRAVPGYLSDILGDQHTRQTYERWKDIPPGHRFLLYFHGLADKISCEYQEEDRKLKEMLNKAKDDADWGTFKSNNPKILETWVPLKDGKRQALTACTGMGRTAKELLKALSSRGEVLTRSVDWGCKAILISPLATGLGNPHPVENGFAFLSPYGVPYIAGSGVKGVFRRAAEELALFHQSGNEHKWTLAHVWAIFGFDENSGFFSRPKKEAASDWQETYLGWLEKVKAEGSDLLEIFGSL